MEMSTHVHSLLQKVLCDMVIVSGNDGHEEDIDNQWRILNFPKRWGGGGNKELANTEHKESYASGIFLRLQRPFSEHL